MEKGEKSSHPWALLALAIPLLYVLSCGPAIFLIEKTHANSDAFEKIYAPLVWLHDHTPMKKPLEVYAEFWQRLAR